MHWNRSLISVATLLLLLTSASGFTTTVSNIRLKSSISQNKLYRPALLIRSKKNGCDKSPSRRQKIWNTSKKTLASLTVALSLFRGPPAAHAKPPPVIQSIKPGLTGAELEAAMDPDVVIYEEQNELIMIEDEKTPTNKKEKVKSKAKTKTKPKSKNLYGDEDEEDDDDDIEFEEMDAKKRSTEGEASTDMTSNTNNLGFVHNKEYSSLDFVKAFAVFAAIPVTFFCTIETYRRTHEKSYVKKALKIQEMKKAEYNQKLKAEEEKRLAEMKANETNVDEDEEDEDAEEDEDDPTPKPPKTPPPSGGGDSSGDGGDSPPSQDEIDRLNKLMGR